MEVKTKAKTIKVKGETLNEDIVSTMSILSKIVGSTLGPGGNVVLLERPGLPPLITKDGVTVASFISMSDATHHVISEAAKEVCQKTNREAGDGTTTAIVLAEALVRHGLKYLEQNPGESPQQVSRDLKELVSEVVSELRSLARQVEGTEDLRNVAMVSANFDEDVANAVVEAIDIVGEDGTIITEEGVNRNTEVAIQEGFPMTKGLSRLGVAQEIFITDPQNQECVLDNPHIVLFDGDINVPQDLGLFLKRMFDELKDDVRPMVVVAHKFSPQVVKMLAMNMQANVAQIVPLETPSTAQPHSKHHFLHDLAAFSGAEVLDPITNTFSQADSLSLGTVGKVRAGRYETFFFESPEDAPVEERLEALRIQMANAESDYDAEIIKERLGTLVGGIATIYVGGSSDLEIKEKRDRIEDAINATRSAIEMGIVPGGGATLLAASQKLLTRDNTKQCARILIDALKAPFVRIAQNAGENPQAIGEAASTVVESASKGLPTMVFDSFKHEWVDPFESGIVDPVKVTTSALQNALSIASMLFTLGGAIVIPRDTGEEAAAEVALQNLAKQMQGV